MKLSRMYSFLKNLTCHKCTLPSDVTLNDGESYVMVYDETNPADIQEYCASVQVLNCQVMRKKSEMLKCEVCEPGYRFVDFQCKPFNCKVASDIPQRYSIFFYLYFYFFRFYTKWNFFIHFFFFTKKL